MQRITLKQSGLRWLWLTGLMLVLDIGTKYWVMNSIGYGWEHRIEIFPFFNLLHVHNYGAAFSFLSDAGGWQRWFFSSLALAVCTLLLVWMRQLPATTKLLNIAYALVISGALGNLFDRLIHGFVVDFLDFYYKHYHWPAFNVADIAICVGAGLILLESFLHEDKSQAAGDK